MLIDSLLNPKCFNNTQEPGEGLPASGQTQSTVCPMQPGKSKGREQGCPPFLAPGAWMVCRFQGSPLLPTSPPTLRSHPGSTGESFVVPLYRGRLLNMCVPPGMRT